MPKLAQNNPAVIHPEKFFDRELTEFDRLNNLVADKLGNLLGSMNFFYVCLILDIFEIPAVIESHSVIAWITYISQTVIQLVALPIISTQSNIIQKKSEAKADADHQALTHVANVVDEILSKVTK